MKYEEPNMQIIEFMMNDVITGSQELIPGGQMGDGDSGDAGDSGLF